MARLGGDEFMVFMKDIYSVEIVHEKAQRLLQIALPIRGRGGHFVRRHAEHRGGDHPRGRKDV